MTGPADPQSEDTPQDSRLYGRRRGHALRPRQQRLLDVTLPRLRFPAEAAADPRAAFAAPASAPLRETWLEIGFGGGEHALAQAAANPEAGLIACEVFENGLCSLLTRLVPEGGEADAPLPPNLRLWPEDARVLLGRLAPGSLDRVFLLFPDPWPKARHAKRRFVNPGNLALVARALRPGGEWRIASDHPVYQAWVEEVMGAQDLFERVAFHETRPEGWPGTRYEAKAHREGRTPWFWSFRRR
ncbi:tRNA (guanine(46)-N(7))-methyltransferase TrmB [Roseomonas sp. NAR14]|uniref:tRNA (guanine-N(7)-)-methyltransferase n=1 Tax=Roseomonas acroporae TaxID=2937791 RepID=A0A9X2BYW6_9PROT|nr:tRNA (guanine(46)-N(7))-methyltransferase TrmB [Roseomonas acroporae]MCK8787409.1 tRNA (guanine(46)-N(7))-methyltransferase TrmB [Roseomonas acroporae]